METRGILLQKNISEIMKTLQSDLTTPEQSKRLQELGLPVKSADCLSRPDGKEIGIYQPVTPCRIDEFIAYANKRYGRTYYIPVWSVGRLMEIVNMCCTDDNVKDEIAIEVMFSNKNSAQLIIEMVSEYAYVMDFSKLEE